MPPSHGCAVGSCVGVSLGDAVAGDADGFTLGLALGLEDGVVLGDAVLGATEGFALGLVDGAAVGETDDVHS